MTNISRDSDVVELNGPPAFGYGEKVRSLRAIFGFAQMLFALSQFSSLIVDHRNQFFFSDSHLPQAPTGKSAVMASGPPAPGRKIPVGL